MFLTRLKTALELVMVFVLMCARTGAFENGPRGAFDVQSPTTEIVTVPTKPTEPVTDPAESVARIAGRIRDNYAPSTPCAPCSRRRAWIDP